MEIILIRHGEPHRHPSPSEMADPALSELGQRQADLVAEYLAVEGIDAIYASPLRRAQLTAAPLAQTLGLGVTVREDLAEFDRSDQYIHFEDLEDGDSKYAAILREDLSAWGTTVEEFRAKVTAEMERIIADHPGQKVAVVAHGGVANAYLGSLLGASRLLIHNPAYTGFGRVLASRSGIRELSSMNETPHLRSLADV